MTSGVEMKWAKRKNTLDAQLDVLTQFMTVKLKRETKVSN